MTLSLGYGSLFDSDAELLVDPVNCIGVSGKGLSKEFAKRYPSEVAWYARSAKRGSVTIGGLILVSPEFHSPGRYIAFVPTKRHWRDRSRIEDIQTVAASLAEMLRASGFTSVAVPALGCGLGGLSWKDVEPILRRELKLLPMSVLLYMPQ